MTDSHAPAHAWQTLAQIVEAQDAGQLQLFLRDLELGEMVHTLYQLEEETRLQLLQMLPADQAAHVIEHMTDDHAADVIEELPPDKAAAIVDEMESDDQADIIGELDEEDAQAILAQMNPAEALDAQRLTQYDDDTAGGLMITEYLAFSEHQSVEDVITDLRKNSEEYGQYVFQHIFVVDSAQRLVGIVHARDLIMAQPHILLTAIMQDEPRYVSAATELEALEDFFDRYPFFGAPVVESDNRLVGVVRRAAVEEAISERSEKALAQFGGIIGGEELRTMKTGPRVLRRLAYLCPLIGLSFISASVIGAFSELISRVAIIAMFLPMVSGLSGAAGNQAVAVSMRELTLGVVRPKGVRRVILKELAVGIFNAIIIGAILAGIAAFWGSGTDQAILGVIVGSAFIINCLFAVALGGSIPLLLKGIGVDPAMASSPILTTTTDLMGFLLTLTLAALLLAK